MTTTTIDRPAIVPTRVAPAHAASAGYVETAAVTTPVITPVITASVKIALARPWATAFATAMFLSTQGSAPTSCRRRRAS